jgi:hypothetical protein
MVDRLVPIPLLLYGAIPINVVNMVSLYVKKNATSTATAPEIFTSEMVRSKIQGDRGSTPFSTAITPIELRIFGVEDPQS